MKSLILLLTLFVSAVAVGAPDFIELQPNSFYYSVGEKAVLVSSVRSSPTNPNSEVFMRATLDGAPIKITKFAETEAASITPVFVSEGTHVWTVNAYLQDRDFVRNLELNIIKSQDELVVLREKLESETNSDKIQLLNEAITFFETDISALESRIESHRVLVQQESLEFEVHALKLLGSGPILEISTSSPTNTFNYGDPVTVYFKVIEGTNGPVKSNIAATVNYSQQNLEQVNENLYKVDVAYSDLFVGSLQITANYYYKNRYSSDSLLKAYMNAGVRTAELEVLRDSAINASLKSYYQRELDDVLKIREAFFDIEGRLYVSSGLYELIGTINESPPVFRRISTGSNFSCGIFQSGVRCWGQNTFGQLGTSDNTARLSPATSPIQGLDTNVWSLTVGSEHACAIRNKDVMCWGKNTYGQLGTGDQDNSNYPLYGPLYGASKISAGERHTCGISDGKVYCWGANDVGQLGDGSTVALSTSAVEVDSLNDIVDISAGTNFTCALKKNGDVYCWGRNYSGQLGAGFYSDYENVPHPVYNLSDVKSISVGLEVGCALTRVGGVKCWGDNSSGQLGAYATGGNLPSPLDIQGAESNVTSIDVGTESVCAVISGALKCWGKATNGSLGNGFGNGLFTLPSGVSGITSNVGSISQGNKFGCAIHNSVLKCWGVNYGGNLGNGTASGVHSLTPSIIANPPSFLKKDQ